ncbi:hypothetical protein K505DRAFT_387464 [Melanomma pulvis-pyrius CBS 109.77]|uniref:Zn(2)-C6 fungal-type domain-containing protein n=1 Tax=Melanomma pulvis-pyrius CBS 109.77 TaxID=1314802 RepID=A0A6A6X848_9PLEO|nr:hypothetical protein K505DRAFT_387464 [Melanomma pulvis-pyrius CBS 109.77]
MTRTGKCDTCRLRKVKCDEKHPKCSACSLKDRSCSYTYGQLSAVVIEDPNQYSSHGKSKTTPLIYPLRLLSEVPSEPHQDTKLRITMEKEAEKGAKKRPTRFPSTPSTITLSRKQSTSPRLDLLRRFPAHFSSIPSSLESPESTLTARYIRLFSASTLDKNPFSILGSWITSIPARMAYDPALYLAVEYAVNAFLKFCEPSWGRSVIAGRSRARGLKSLHGALSEQAEEKAVRYDLVLATKLHFSAEVLMGLTACYHTIHASGITEMLKFGTVEGIDEQHFWDLIDNTYIDDVSESLLAGRVSVYDNDTYLSLTSPLSLSLQNPPPSPFQTASTLVMHSFIQITRLACLVRHSVAYPADIEVLTSALSLAESLWVLDPSTPISTVLASSTTLLSIPPCPSIADIIPSSLHFCSIQVAILLTRYWMLRLHLCGVIQTLYRYFSAYIEGAGVHLPCLEEVRDMDKEAAVNVAMSVPYAITIEPNLPLVPLRLLPVVQISMGPWYRAVQRLEKLSSPSGSTSVLESTLDDAESEMELSKARRMQDWVVEQGNQIHDAWGLERVSVEYLKVGVDIMAGEEIPGWVPRRIRFEQGVGDELVMRLEYSN